MTLQSVTFIRLTFIPAGLVLVSFMSLFAQNTIEPKAGDRVRVTAALETMTSSMYIGKVLAVTIDSLVLKPTNRPEPLVKLPMSSISTIQLSRGHASRGANVLRGMGIGILSGAVFGAIVGYVAGGDNEFDSDCAGLCPETKADTAIISAVLFSAPGLVVGGLVGLARDTERWQEVPLKNVRVGILPRNDDGFLLKVKIAL